MGPYPWCFSGTVIRVFAPEPKEGKQQFCSITLSYKVPKKNAETGEWERQSVYVDAVSFGKTAEAMMKVEEGSVLSVMGEPRATAYLNDDDQAVGKLQLFVSQWAYAPSPFVKDDDEAPKKFVKKEAKPVKVAAKAEAVLDDEDESDELF